MSEIRTVGVIGAGAWGTALAATLGRAGRSVLLWAREPEVAEQINTTGENAAFLPGVGLNGVTATTDLAEAAGRDALLLAVPAQFLRAVGTELAPHWRPGTPAVICAKGVETGTTATLDQVTKAVLPDAPLAILSGPTFAIEVARGLPTAITLACADTGLGRRLVEVIGTPHFRPYLTDDVTGVALGGAVKNVIAIACGVVEGRGLGDNARAALIARGLAEIVRLVVAHGGRAETCMGLSGLGDLVLTASSTQSRNYSLGHALGAGRRLADILAERQSVTEGVASAASVAALGERLGVDMPVCKAVAGMLHRDVGVDETVAGLLSRPFRGELGFGG